METWSGGAETDCDGMGSTGVSLGRPFTSDFGRRSVPLCFLTWANRERFATEQSRTAANRGRIAFTAGNSAFVEQSRRNLEPG